MIDSTEDLTINLDIEEAIQEGNLTIQYQPIYNIRALNPILVEAEALIRWNHSVLGLLNPTDFNLWQQSNQIMSKLTDYVLERVVEQLFVWKNKKISMPVAVNLSLAIISDIGFPDRLSNLLDDFKVDHASLILDLSNEGNLILSEFSIQIINTLKRNGFQLILDDFSGEPDCMSRLDQLEITGVKLDARLIEDLINNEEVKDQLRDIIERMHDQNLQVYAKRIEDQISLSILKILGCDKALGWYLGKPVTASLLTPLLENQREELIN